MLSAQTGLAGTQPWDSQINGIQDPVAKIRQGNGKIINMAKLTQPKQLMPESLK